MGATTQSFKYLAACFAPLHLWLFVILRTCASHVMDPEAFQALCCPLHGCMYKSGSCRCTNDLFMCSTKLDMQPNRRNPLAGNKWLFTWPFSGHSHTLAKLLELEGSGLQTWDSCRSCILFGHCPCTWHTQAVWISWE